MGWCCWSGGRCLFRPADGRCVRGADGVAARARAGRRRRTVAALDSWPSPSRLLRWLWRGREHTLLDHLENPHETPPPPSCSQIQYTQHHVVAREHDQDLAGRQAVPVAEPGGPLLVRMPPAPLAHRAAAARQGVARLCGSACLPVVWTVGSVVSGGSSEAVEPRPRLRT